MAALVREAKSTVRLDVWERMRFEHMELLTDVVEGESELSLASSRGHKQNTSGARLVACLVPVIATVITQMIRKRRWSQRGLGRGRPGGAPVVWR